MLIAEPICEFPQRVFTPGAQLKARLAGIAKLLRDRLITKGEAKKGISAAHREIREANSRPMDSWTYRGQIVWAYTKSEARALFKRMFKVSRLVEGATVQRFDPNEVPF